MNVRTFLRNGARIVLLGAVTTCADDLQAEWAKNLPTIAATWTNLNAGSLGIGIKARP